MRVRVRQKIEVYGPDPLREAVCQPTGNMEELGISDNRPPLVQNGKYLTGSSETRADIGLIGCLSGYKDVL